MAGSGRSDGRDDLIIEALLRGASQREAATHADTSERTVRRRVGDAGFQRRLQEAHTEIVKRVQRKIVAATFSAIDALHAVATNGNGEAAKRGAAVRVNAARALLAAFSSGQPSRVELDATISTDQQDSALEKLRTLLDETQQNRDESEQVLTSPANGHGNGANGAN